MYFVIFGVCGSGKSTLARQLANHFKSGFIEADDYHSNSNKSKLTEGAPLDDNDRLPWLEDVCRAALSIKHQHVFISCSALKQIYRDIFVKRLQDVRFILLHGSYKLKEKIEERLKNRTGHFMNPKLLDSQLQTLEMPDPLSRYIIIEIINNSDKYNKEPNRELVNGIGIVKTWIQEK